MPLHTADLQDIKARRVTDLYFVHTREVLSAHERDPVVTAEVKAGSVPAGYDFGVFCGLEEMLGVLEGLPLDVDGLPEGSYFRRGEPLLEITGRYLQFCELETALLGLLCQASGVATKAAGCRLAAGDRTLISFGARRMHPAVAPMIDRAAYLGGCDGFSTVMAADLVGKPASGTMPHALIIVAGGLATALRWFDETVAAGIPRIALIDTFEDEKFSALIAAETLGERLSAVRLDTPSSRRGDMLELLREVRWELDLRGYQHVRLFVSGGLEEAEIRRLNELADGYGVGTAISNAEVCDMSLDIVAVEGEPLAKRGKPSGVKQVLACPQCRLRRTVPERAAPERLRCGCGGEARPLLQPLLRQGQLVSPSPAVAQLRDFCREELRTWLGAPAPLRTEEGSTPCAPQ